MGIQFTYPLINDKNLTKFKFDRETIYKKPKKQHQRMFRNHNFNYEEIEFKNIINYSKEKKDKFFTLFRCPNCLSIIDIFLESSIKKIFINFDCYCGKSKVEINEFISFYLSNPIKEVFCDNHKEKKAICYCKNLFQFLCEECYEYIKNNEKKSIFYSLNKIYLFCEKHNSNFYSFCFTCGKNFCIKCEEHLKHYYITYEKYIQIKKISFKNVNNIINHYLTPEKFNDYLKDYSKILSKRELNELTLLFNKNYFSNRQLYCLGELICFIFEYNIRLKPCFQIICNMNHFECYSLSNNLKKKLKDFNDKKIIVKSFEKAMKTFLINSSDRNDLNLYYNITYNKNEKIKTKFDDIQSKNFISLDNGKIYFNLIDNNQIYYFDNDDPFNEEKPKFLIEYNNIQFFFVIKSKKLLGIASLKSFLLYDYQNNKNFQEIFTEKNIYKIIELSNNMIAVNIEKNNIFFYKYDKLKNNYLYDEEPMKKINEKVNTSNFEICSGIDIFMIVDSSYIYFIDINHNFKLLVRLKTLNQAYLPDNINIYTNIIPFMTLSKNQYNQISGIYINIYDLVSLQTITSNFQNNYFDYINYKYDNINTQHFSLLNNGYFFFCKGNYLYFINKYTFTNEYLVVGNSMNNIIETKNHHLLYHSSNVMEFIHYNHYKNIYK